jgi:hypothetical protein
MENRNSILIFILALVISLICYGLIVERSEPLPINTHVCKEDSLNKIVDSLQLNIKMLEDGFDSKERRYEDILFEYELGLNHIEILYPKAFKEFHRVIAHKEYFTHESMHENNKRLNIKDEHNR